MTLIIALDRIADPGLVEKLCGIADGIKVGLPAVLRGGLEWAYSIASKCSGLKIIDFKLADIAPVMVSIVDEFARYYNAFIAHSFIGVDGGLGELKRHLDTIGAKLILVASMSHRGSMEVYDAARHYIYNVIDAVKPWGLVAPATRPSVIHEFRERFSSMKILSPGVGAQGAKPGSAICSGADYEIIGRLIMDSSDPVSTAGMVKGIHSRVVRDECSG